MPQEKSNYEEEYAGWVDDQLFDSLLDSLAFADFEQNMDDRLDSLVAKWAPWAAPNAGAIRRSVKFPSAQPSAKVSGVKTAAKPKPK